MRAGKKLGNRRIEVRELLFYDVDIFKYVGVMIISDGDRVRQIIFGVQKILKKWNNVTIINKRSRIP